MHPSHDGCVRVRGAREHNLKRRRRRHPARRAGGVHRRSGSGKSSLAFGTLYAEAQRRYLESVSPYARRLFHQTGVPEVDEIDGPAAGGGAAAAARRADVALVRRQRDHALEPAAHALLARRQLSAGRSDDGRRRVLAQHAGGRVPGVPWPGRASTSDGGLARAGSVADHPRARRRGVARRVAGPEPARHPHQLGHDVDRPWRELPKKDRDWILFTDEQPWSRSIPATRRDEARARRQGLASYMGTFSSAERHVMHTLRQLAERDDAAAGAQFMVSAACPVCGGKRLRPESLAVTFAGLDIAELAGCRWSELAEVLRPDADGESHGAGARASIRETGDGRRADRAATSARASRSLLDLGLGYLTSTAARRRSRPASCSGCAWPPSCAPGLFGVVYVLDEPSAGLHPADTEALLEALDRLKAAGNSLFVVEHDIDVVAPAPTGSSTSVPRAGEQRRRGALQRPARGPADVEASRHARASCFGRAVAEPRSRASRPAGCSCGASPATTCTASTSTCRWACSPRSPASRARASPRWSARCSSSWSPSTSGQRRQRQTTRTTMSAGARTLRATCGGSPAAWRAIKRLVRVDQKPIGRTPRSNLATYTGLFDAVRKVFAATEEARARGYDAGPVLVQRRGRALRDLRGRGLRRGRAALPARAPTRPCPTCHGARYNPEDAGGHATAARRSPTCSR